MEINKAASAYYLEAILAADAAKEPAVKIKNPDADLLNPKDTAMFSPEALEAANNLRGKIADEAESGNFGQAQSEQKDAKIPEIPKDDSSASAAGASATGSSSDKIAELKGKLEKLASQLSQVMNSSKPDEMKESQAAPIQAQISEVASQIAALEAEAAKEKSAA